MTANSTSTQNRDFIDKLHALVGRSNVVTGGSQLRYYSTGMRSGHGNCLAVVMASTLVEIWRTLQLCVAHDKIIIMQAAKTGLNGGSTPFGDDYDRDIVIISTLKIDQITLLNNGMQVVALAGATLNALEKKLAPFERGPHSVIGSSCIGASIVGGVCNNSGGNLVNRGPAYTEYSLYAQLDKNGSLNLVNHLDIELGNTPEQILQNLQAGNFNHNPKNTENSARKLASDTEYQQRVRAIDQSSPARFNADKRRLYESSGCAGKLAVFAVRLDTFENPERELVFYVGTSRPDLLNTIRRSILTEFNELPEMGEYMHRSYFDGSEKYSKDIFLVVKHLGTAMLPRILRWKGRIEGFLSKLPLVSDKLTDHCLQLIANLLPNHLPDRLRLYRDRFEHHLIIKAVDGSIEETQKLLDKLLPPSADNKDSAYFICNREEAESALLHRFVAGNAYSRYTALHQDEIGGVLTLDVALPRNYTDWHSIYPPEIMDKILIPFQLSHFLCMVFHHDFIVKKGVDIEQLKADMLEILDAKGAKYPAEHNVGHLYYADSDLREHYVECDPCNSFNPGIGKTSKNKNYGH